jgi:hypothetical protein
LGHVWRLAKLTPSPSVGNLNGLTTKLKEESSAFSKAADDDERVKVADEKAELENRKILGSHRTKLLTRLQLLVTDAAYAAAFAEVQTTGIIKRANELLDMHLATAARVREDAE